MESETVRHRTVEEIDWRTWVPTERGSLCYICQDSRVLLIHKKTGLGAGKINAPGGRIEPDETPLHAAIRETQEEVGVTPSGLQKRGELFFEFTNGYNLHCTVFFASGFSGEPVETSEAKPFWCAVSALPYERMWEDDRHWMPPAFAGTRFAGYFVFDEDRMLSKRVVALGNGEES